MVPLFIYASDTFRLAYLYRQLPFFENYMTIVFFMLFGACIKQVPFQPLVDKIIPPIPAAFRWKLRDFLWECFQSNIGDPKQTGFGMIFQVERNQALAHNTLVTPAVDYFLPGDNFQDFPLMPEGHGIWSHIKFRVEPLDGLKGRYVAEEPLPHLINRGDGLPNPWSWQVKNLLDYDWFLWVIQNIYTQAMVSSPQCLKSRGCLMFKSIISLLWSRYVIRT